MEERNTGIDIIRIFAFFCVVSVHFFLNIGFYGIIISDNVHFTMLYLRDFFMVCVPLFLVITGYLQCDKKICLKHYRGVFRILFEYLVCSIITYFFRTIYLHETYDLKGFFRGVLEFNMCQYAWYIEMYLGLFLLIPFLNAGYKALESNKEKMVLLISLIVMTSLPTITNAFILNGDTEKFPFLPDFWMSLWPITYYFIGTAIKEYKPKINPVLNIILILLVTFVYAKLAYDRSEGNIMEDAGYSGWGGVFTLVNTTLVFILLLNIKGNELPMFVRKVIKLGAEVTLSAYLLSFVFDRLMYKRVFENALTVRGKLKFFVPTVSKVFVCSMAAGLLVCLAWKALCLPFKVKNDRSADECEEVLEKGL